MTRFVCPVCGYDGLKELPYQGSANLGSYEICSSCGFEFGVDDDVKDITHEEWRKQWVESGMKWWSRSPTPPGWDPVAQLERVRPAP